MGSAVAPLDGPGFGYDGRRDEFGGSADVVRFVESGHQDGVVAGTGFDHAG